MLLDWAQSHLPVKHWPVDALTGVKFPYSHLMKTPVLFGGFFCYDRLALMHCLVVCLQTLYKKANPGEEDPLARGLEKLVRSACECDLDTLNESTPEMLDLVLKHKLTAEVL